MSHGLLARRAMTVVEARELYLRYLGADEERDYEERHTLESADPLMASTVSLPVLKAAFWEPW